MLLHFSQVSGSLRELMEQTISLLSFTGLASVTVAHLFQGFFKGSKAVNETQAKLNVHCSTITLIMEKKI